METGRTSASTAAESSMVEYCRGYSCISRVMAAARIRPSGCREILGAMCEIHLLQRKPYLLSEDLRSKFSFIPSIN